MTFSADKSVSLLWALGNEETRSQVLEAFDEATFQAMGYLESVASATRGASNRLRLCDDRSQSPRCHHRPHFHRPNRSNRREWAYVAMSRGRQANSLYLASPEAGDEQCSHLAHTGRHEALDGFTAVLNRGSTQIAAIDHAEAKLTDDIDPVGPPPPSSDVAARVAWQIAKRQTERNAAQRQTPGLDLAAGR